MKISVVIPTLNRPAYLREAVASVAAQSHDDWEIVLVDDGSVPPVDPASLPISASRLVCIRHDLPMGVARAKNAGIRAASGEIITLLDDDDMLTPAALATIGDAFCCDRELDCVFMAVEPFGPYARGVAEGRELSLARFRQLAENRTDGLYRFDERLFDALLDGVPIDFQRPAARRGCWNIVGGFDEVGLFSESAWAMRASHMCRVALTAQALTRWRIHDMNFGWLQQGPADAAKSRQIENTTASMEALLGRFQLEGAKQAARLRSLRKAASEQYFDLAYLFRDRPSRPGLRALLRSFALRPRLKQLKLVAVMLMPWKSRAG